MREPSTWEEYRKKFDRFETVEYANTWKSQHWNKVEEDLNRDDLAKAVLYFAGVVAGLNAIGA